MIRAWLVLACLALPSLASAKDFCVNSATGSDGTAYASLNMSSCTATIRRAADVALAGDHVYVAAGTYNAAGTASRWVPSLNPANEGTAGNPIVFEAVGTVNIGLSSSTGPMIGCSARDYVTWIGFTIDEANGTSEPDTGPVTAHDSTGCRLEYLTIDGNGNGHGQVDNHNGIRVESCTDCYVGHCTIHSVTSLSPNPNNGAGIMVYASEGLTLENNHISSSGSGIFLKGGPSGGWTGTMRGATVRFNLVENVSNSALIANAGVPSAVATPTRIYQNVVNGAGESCFRVWFFGDAQDPQNVRWINNTGYDCGSAGIQYAGTPGASLTHGIVFRNTLISGATSGISSEQQTWHQDATDDDHEQSLYHSISGTFAVLNGGGTNVTLANWKLSPYTQDAATPDAITSDPQFVTAGSDFHLQAGSPALTHGRVLDSIGGTDGDTIPVGAYITGSETIGPTTGGGGGGGGATGGGAGARIRVRVGCGS